MNQVPLLLRQVRYENRAFWRNPAAAFFTFVFPLIFMVVFNAIFGRESFGNSGLTAGSFFTPAIVAFSVVNACYTNLAMSVTAVREEGILKRVRGTPLSAWVYLLARMGLSVLIALLLVLVVSVFGAVVYNVPFPFERLPQLLLVLVVGSACFCGLGLAVSGLVPNERAAPAVVNATILPLLFISDVFIKLPADNFLAQIANIFPVRHLALALQSIWTPQVSGSLNLVDVLVVAVWAVVGLLAAMRTFTWEPRT